MMRLYKLCVSNGLEYDSLGDFELNLKKGDQVIVRCERYMDFASIVKAGTEDIADAAAYEQKWLKENKGRHIEGQKLPVIVRLATEEDKAVAKENDEKARKAHLQTLDRIKAHNLEMKLIHTHYAFDSKLIIFQFSAEGRVDFRELLRDLSALFRMRVELRQIGVRDETAVLGGIGTCGRPFCCASFLPSFSSINVKMAKQQGLSLNPQNISGCCGRLKCCLQYEADVYQQLAEERKAQQTAATTDDTESQSGDNEPQTTANRHANGGNSGNGGNGNGTPSRNEPRLGAFASHQRQAKAASAMGKMAHHENNSNGQQKPHKNKNDRRNEAGVNRGKDERPQQRREERNEEPRGQRPEGGGRKDRRRQEGRRGEAANGQHHDDAQNPPPPPSSTPLSPQIPNS